MVCDISILINAINNQQIINNLMCLGMCELGGTATMQNEKSKRVDSGGFVVDHVQIKIVDLNTGEALGPNQPGELYCTSPTRMLGYYKDPKATKETMDENGMSKNFNFLIIIDLLPVV